MADVFGHGEGFDDPDLTGPGVKRRKIFHNPGAAIVGNPPCGETLQALRRCLTRDQYTVGWISALPLEMAAARGMLDEIHDDCGRNQGDNNTYTLGSMAGHNCVIACLPAGVYGTVSATEVASGMRSSFPRIQFWLMVGVAGGAPTERTDIRLGDVVVGTPAPGHNGVVQYDRGKTVADGRLERTGSVNKPPPLLLTAISKLQSESRVQPTETISKWVREMLNRHVHMRAQYASPGADWDVLFESQYEHVGGSDSCEGCDRRRITNRPPRRSAEPVVHYGTIASGNQVIKHSETRDRHARQLGALCFEMEAAGLVSFPSLTIRGICDYSDSHKNKQWQEYSAATAAAFAKELLHNISPVSIESHPFTLANPRIEQRKFYVKSLGFNQMHTRQSTIKSAHPRTCEWLINHEKYQYWLDSAKIPEHQGFLWIKGKPGTGKSTIMKYVCEQASQLKTGALSLSFFFNGRGDILEKSTVGMYRSLLWQLFCAVPATRSITDSMGPGRPNEDGGLDWSLSTLQDLLQRAVDALGQQTLLCFIDALDECHESEVREMVDFLADLSSLAHSASLHICFASRHYPHITFNRGLELILENQEGHDRDLSHYINSKLAGIRHPTIEDVKLEILAKASSIFLWAVLAIDILRREYDRGRMTALRRRLKEIPQDLTRLFQDILTRDQDNMADSFVCLQWIVFARRPLTPDELYFAIQSYDKDVLMEVETPADPSVVKRFILSCSKGLAEITRSRSHPTVQFIHESVRDFLLKEGGMRDVFADLHSGFIHENNDLLKYCCCNYIQACFSRGFLTITELPSANSTRTTALRKRTVAMLPFIQYVTDHIFEHADAAETEGFPQASFLNNFPLQRWIYVNNLFENETIARYSFHASSLYIFTEWGLLNLVKILLRQGVSINTPGERYGSPIIAAVEIQDLSVLREMVLPNSEYPRLEDDLTLHFTRAANDVKGGRSLVPSAIKNDRASALRLLLDLGIVKPDTTDCNGTSLLYMATANRRTSIVELLLNAGADPNRPGEHIDGIEYSCLFPSVWRGHPEIVLLLVDAGADPNFAIRKGGLTETSPLNLAIIHGRKEIFELLLARGADPYLPSRETYPRDCLPLHSATFGSQRRMVELLLNWGVDPNMAMPDGRRALTIAAERDAAEIAKMLIAEGAEVNFSANYQDTPLWVAASCGHVAVTKLLIRSGAHVKHDHELWNEPLVHAVMKDDCELAFLWLKHGADANYTSVSYGQPLAIALQKGSVDMIDTLITSGAKAHYKKDLL
ncbi:ankyrin repeat-containing domain protein [Aspergillus bertholletiae]|uniref:Ankyrin repeat-containing domain protein n=1 Tax=Aspergillus bertholletiae TaxID=1226010 RepID=A0A5N7B8L3_9EURO|nr:ankyrin repeat-containing domain protein [Aspergillus bertholletiae]